MQDLTPHSLFQLSTSQSGIYLKCLLNKNLSKLHIRASFTKKLSYDHKILFLAQIPSYDSVQTGLYRIRREFIPAAPSTQVELNTGLDWFLVSRDPQESLVKGDVIHSDGLRVLLFATDESLNILARTRTILADGTFRITPYLWYQVFTHSFVPVAFGLLPDKKRYWYKLQCEQIIKLTVSRRSYDDLFSLLKKSLDHPSRNLALSAEWLMSDSETNLGIMEKCIPWNQVQGVPFLLCNG
jgi:hypothetical protein